MKPIVICGFPGVGKSAATQGDRRTDIIDLDSSAFSHIIDYDNCTTVVNPNFPKNYIDKVEEIINSDNEVSVILISIHSEVLDELYRRGIKAILVLPLTMLKDEYLKRYLKRGDSIEFIYKLNSNWSYWLSRLRNDERFVRLWLDSGEYLSEILPK